MTQRVNRPMAVVAALICVLSAGELRSAPPRIKVPLPEQPACSLTHTATETVATVSAVGTVNGDTLRVSRTITVSPSRGFLRETTWFYNDRPILNLQTTAQSTGLLTAVKIYPSTLGETPLNILLVQEEHSTKLLGKVANKSFVPTERSLLMSSPEMLRTLKLTDGAPNPLATFRPIEISKLSQFKGQMHVPKATDCTGTVQHFVPILSTLGATTPTATQNDSNSSVTPRSLKGHFDSTNTEIGCFVDDWLVNIVKSIFECLLAESNPFTSLFDLITGDIGCGIGELNSILAGYQPGGACCPKGCNTHPTDLGFGLSAFFQCCDSDETCLNSNGLCCAPNTAPCGGKTCCETDKGETCNAATGGWTVLQTRR